MVSAGNDGQFAILSEQVFERGHWAQDERFKTNSNRVKHREELIGMIEKRLADHTTAQWVEKLTGKGLPFA
jgi:succinate--hydroxymethylglutarate CoA-transferase